MVRCLFITAFLFEATLFYVLHCFMSSVNWVVKLLLTIKLCFPQFQILERMKRERGLFFNNIHGMEVIGIMSMRK